MTDISLSQKSKLSDTTFVFSTNLDFVPCLAVLLRSILDHANPIQTYRLVVLHKELSEESRNTLISMTLAFENITLEFINVRKEMIGYHFYTENRDNITQEAYFRLLIPWLLPETDKAVYLDCDMVALTDIASLYNTNVDKVLIAAARDLVGIGIYYSGRFGRRDYFDNELCFSNPDDYFISGVLVMNLTRFREKFSKKQLLDYAISRAWQFHDQDILNLVCQKEKKLISARWGALGRSEYEQFLPPKLRIEAVDAYQDPYLFHFAGPKDKPWHRTSSYSLSWFWPTAARTPYYDVLMEKFALWQKPDQVVLKGEKNMIKRFLKKFLPMSAKQSNFEFRCLEHEMAEQRMLTLQLMMQLQRLESSKDQNISPSQLSRKQELLAASKGRVNCIKHITPHTKLRFEIDLVGHCNMTCAGCAHFSPLCKEEFVNLLETKLDFERLSELFGGEVEYIHLLGGEPLLHPQIAELAEMARYYFPIGRIEIVSNGTLLPNQDKHFWEVCRDKNITLSVTKYPTSFAYEELPALAALHGVKFQFYNHSADETVTFNKLKLDLSGNQDPDLNFLNCYLANECIFLKKGRLYPCSIISHIGYFNDYFKQDLPVTGRDSIDIYDVQNKDEILNFLAQPVPFCAYCDIAGRKHSLSWRPTEKDISEWT